MPQTRAVAARRGGPVGALILGAGLLAATLVTDGPTPVVETRTAVNTASVVPAFGPAGRDGRGRTSAELKALLTRPGMRITAYPTADAPTCAETARGQVQAHLRANPCTGLRRVGLEVRDGPGAVGLISVSTVRMPDEAAARALKEVLDRGGSGNINELTRERGAFRGVRYTGRYHASAQAGSLVIVADGEPATPPLPAPALTLLVGEAAN
jgi:hypothetical protein